MRQHVEQGDDIRVNYYVQKGFSEARFCCNKIDTSVIHECLAYILTFNTSARSESNDDDIEKLSDRVRLQSSRSSNRSHRGYHTSRRNSVPENVRIKIVLDTGDGKEKILSISEIQQLLGFFSSSGKH
jgi:hypothetical protein